MPYSVAPSLDHVERGLAKFLDCFQGKPNLEALLASYLRQIQKLENCWWEIILFRLLSKAEGIQQDMLGKIVGRGRGDLTDAFYFYAIRAQIRINRSCGTPEDLIEVTRLSIPDGDLFTYDEWYPAGVQIQILEPLAVPIDLLYTNLLRTKAGGVQLYLLWSTVDDVDTWAFSPDDSPLSDDARGYADVDGTPAGGAYISVIA